MEVQAQSWQGTIQVKLWHDEKTGLDMALVTRKPHSDYDTSRSIVLYEGAVSCEKVKTINTTSGLDLLEAALHQR